MIDQNTYELLKRIHEFPCKWDENQFEYGRFEAKYRALYGDTRELTNLYEKLFSLGYLRLDKEKVQFFFTDKSHDAIKEYENAMNQNNSRTQLEDENIKLQNEQLRYQNQIRNKENEIRDLTAKNLQLQNKQLKNKIVYAILGGAIMFILSNWQDILTILQIMIKNSSNGHPS